MDLSQFNVILSHPSWDIIAIFLFIAFGFFYGISSGKKRIISLIISLYIAGFFYENFFYIDELIGGKTIIETFLFKGFIFLALVLGLNVLFLNILAHSSESRSKEWWQILLLSFLGTGLLFSFIFQLFPAKEIFTFSPLIEHLFASDKAFFWWLLAPLITLFLTRK